MRPGDGHPQDSIMKELSHSILLRAESTLEERPQNLCFNGVLNKNFDFCGLDAIVIPSLPILRPWTRMWKTLSQVCRRWRHTVFASPQRLDLRVLCTDTTPTRTTLDIWPSFPISMVRSPSNRVDEKGVENIVAALEHCDRIPRSSSKGLRV